MKQPAFQKREKYCEQSFFFSTEGIIKKASSLDNVVPKTMHFSQQGKKRIDAFVTLQS